MPPLQKVKSKPRRKDALAWIEALYGLYNSLSLTTSRDGTVDPVKSAAVDARHIAIGGLKIISDNPNG